jgi:hypothetical protein
MFLIATDNNATAKYVQCRNFRMTQSFHLYVNVYSSTSLTKGKILKVKSSFSKERLLFHALKPTDLRVEAVDVFEEA